MQICITCIFIDVYVHIYAIIDICVTIYICTCEIRKMVCNLEINKWNFYLIIVDFNFAIKLEDVDWKAIWN
jgi:hypothetical protein